MKIYSNGLSAEDDVDSATEVERTDRLDNMENCVVVEFVWKWATKVFSRSEKYKKGIHELYLKWPLLLKTY